MYSANGFLVFKRSKLVRSACYNFTKLTYNFSQVPVHVLSHHPDKGTELIPAGLATPSHVKRNP